MAIATMGAAAVDRTNECSRTRKHSKSRPSKERVLNVLETGRQGGAGKQNGTMGCGPFFDTTISMAFR